MKIRNSFVSNSSSTSYVFVIPDDFDLDSVDWNSLDEVLIDGESAEESPELMTQEEAKAGVKKFLETGFMDQWVDEEHGGQICYTIDQIFGDYSVSSFETGPDWSGVRVAVTPSIMEKKLNEIKDKLRK